MFLPRPTFFLPYKDSDTLCEPVDPAVSWVGPSILPLGLHPDLNIPDYVTLSNVRCGRVFTWAPPDQGAQTIAFFPASDGFAQVPPCPGFVPEGFDLWAHPSTAFTDGSRGRWDFRYYPQLYESARPWLGFSLNPQHSHPSYPHFSQQNSVYPVELRRIPEFWTWNDPGNSARGGYWNQAMLLAAFKRREEVENSFHATYTDEGKAMQLEKYTLPPYDPLKYDDVSKWKTWREGRDALSRMLLYIAEISAIIAWMKNTYAYEAARQRNPPPNLPPPTLPASCFMGVWAQTITSKEEWDPIAYGGAPIYVAFEVPVKHSLSRHAEPGAPDADERYRQNSFDFFLGRIGSRNVTKFWRFPPTALEYARCLSSPPSLLPPDLIPPRNKFPGQSTTAWHRQWNSYIYQDHAVFRGFLPILLEECRAREFERSQFAVLHPNQRIMTCSLDPHPLLSILPEVRSRGLTYFLELTDGNQRFWPVKVDGHVQSRYRFEYPQERIVVQSARPFPGRSRSIGRVSGSAFSYEDNDRDQSSPDKRPRKYYLVQPVDATVEPALTWEMEKDEGFDVASSIKQVARATPYRIPERRDETAPTNNMPAPSIVFDSYASRCTTIADVLGSASDDTDAEIRMDGDESKPVSSSDVAKALAAQRVEMEREMKRRFFKREWEDWVADELVPGGMKWGDMIYYALRICNWDGDATADNIVALLAKFVAPQELMCIGMHSEADGTRSSDIGFRYAEDALLVWSTLLYVRVGERVLEIYPLKAIPSLFHVSNADFQSRRSKEVRNRTVKHLISRNRILNHSEARTYALGRSLLSLAASFGYSEDPVRSTTALVLDDPFNHAFFPPLINDLKLTQAKVDFPFRALFSNGTNLSLVHTQFANIGIVQVGMADLPPQEMAQKKLRTDILDGRGAKPINPRKKRRKLIRDGDPADQSSLQNMIANERHKLKRAILSRMTHLAVCWKGLDLPPFDATLIKDKDLATFFTHIWEWKDRCRAMGSEFRDATVHDLDFAPFESEFGELGNLYGIYGKDYRDIVTALAQYRARVPH